MTEAPLSPAAADYSPTLWRSRCASTAALEDDTGEMMAATVARQIVEHLERAGYFGAATAGRRGERSRTWALQIMSPDDCCPARELLGWTQRDLAAAADVPLRFVIAFEDGDWPEFLTHYEISLREALESKAQRSAPGRQRR